MVQIDSKIPVGTENKPVGDAQKPAHSSSGGLFEMLFSGLSIPESEAGETLHLSEEDLQSFSVLTGMGYLNSFKGLVDKTASEDILDDETELLSSEISEGMPLFGIDMDALELSLTGENDDPLAGLAKIDDSLTPTGAGLGILSDGAKENGLQQVLVSPKGLPSGLLSGTFNVPGLALGGMNNLSGNPMGSGTSTLAGSLGGNVTLNGLPLQDGPPQLLGENGLKPFSASDMAALTGEDNPDILIRRVMDGMKNNIEFEVQPYGKKSGMKSDSGDLQNMLMRGTSPIANQSGQMMILQNQALQAASQLTMAGQIETTEEARSVLRGAPSVQAGSVSGQTEATASWSFSGGNSGGQGGLAQQNVFLPAGAQVSAKGELDLMQDKWTKNLAERIEKSFRDGQQEIDLILKPKNLGKLNLRLAMNNQSLNVQIKADNQHVVSLLQESETRLMQMLHGSGFKSAQLAFTSGFGDAPGFGNRQNQSQQQDERIANTSQNGLAKSSEENIMVGAKSRSSDHVKTGVDVIA